MKNYKEMWEALIYELEKHEDETWLNFCRVLENQYDISEQEPATRENCPYCGSNNTIKCYDMSVLLADYYCNNCTEYFNGKAWHNRIERNSKIRK